MGARVWDDMASRWVDDHEDVFSPYVFEDDILEPPQDFSPHRVGRKDDTGKPTYDLLPDDALAAINKILDFGKVKYDARDWENGMGWLRCWNACLRHLWAWMRREPCDPESGMSHLWHAGCCILFLISFELRKIGEDNRPPAPPLPPEVTR